MPCCKRGWVQVTALGHNHPVMGFFKWAAACVLAHLVGTCQESTFVWQGDLG